MPAQDGTTGSRVRVLPEIWADRVSQFIRSSVTPELVTATGEGSIERTEQDPDAPEMLFARVYLATQMNYYSDFNIRARHFRCIENFFVLTDDDDELRAVVGLEGIRSSRRVLNVGLIVARMPEEEPQRFLAELLDGVLHEAARYCQAIKLRFTYVYDTSFEAPIGVRMSEWLSDPDPSLPYEEEARVPNETGLNREAVLLSFNGLRPVSASGALDEAPPTAAG